VLKGELQLLDALRRLIAGATRQLRKELTGSQAGQWLRTLPGVSWILSHTILAEVGRFARFPSAGHLASYSLLAPRACDSGDEDGDTPIGRHVGKMGRRTLKWAWMEAAHTAVRSSPRMRALYDRRTDGGQRDKNRGVILVAHELCRIGYLLETKKMAYLENPPAGPTGRRRGVTRSVMG
jgi:transposase